MHSHGSGTGVYHGSACVPQDQEMHLEVKNGALVAAGGQLLSCGEEEQLQKQPDFAVQLCSSSWV